MSSSEPRLVLLGRQGAGKGTQSTRLADHFGVIHVSTGDMFRTQAAQGTAFGLEAKRYMDAGELVPDEIVVGVIEESMVPGGALGGGFVLDGFPRTLHQARELDRVIAGSPLHLVIDLDVPREIVFDRIAGRRVCESCQRVYHVNFAPKVGWTCDTCGGTVEFGGGGARHRGAGARLVHLGHDRARATHPGDLGRRLTKNHAGPG